MRTTQTTALTVFDGYPVQIDWGDHYSTAHLFVRGTYVHPIVIMADGQVVLRDANMFDGPRRVFTPEEMIALRTLAAEVQAEDARKQATAEQKREASLARVQASQERKLADLAEPLLYD